MTHEHAVRTLASERYLLNEMSELERYQFEAHYFDCGECADEVQLGAAIRDEVKAGGARAGAATPATVVTNPGHTGTPRTAMPHAASPSVTVTTQMPGHSATRRLATVVPWAVAATLALVVGYQSSVAVPSSRGDASAASVQALAPVMLRGASRGADTVVAINPAERFVTLGADILAAPGATELTYDLLGPARSAVISGRAPLPPSGAPLLLLIPADRFVGPGTYTLVVRDARTPGADIGEYPFVVKN